MVSNADGAGQKRRLTQHCRYCHKGQRNERKEPVKLQISTNRHMRKLPEGNQRFSLILRLRDNHHNDHHNKVIDTN